MNDRELSAKMAQPALLLAREGRLFNRHLLEEFRRWDSIDLRGMGGLVAVPGEHLVFYKAVAQTLGWLQHTPVKEKQLGKRLEGNPSPLTVCYLQLMLEARRGRVSNVAQRLEELLEDGVHAVAVRKPRRLLGVVAGLETWTSVVLPQVAGQGILDLEEVQRLAMAAGGRARWTALAPIKMYSIYRGLGAATPRTICPPVGRAVSRGIEALLGIALQESEGDYEQSRRLHLKLAELSNTSVWDVNSGFYRLGGGS